MRSSSDKVCWMWFDRIAKSFLTLLLFIPVHVAALTWEDRGGEAIHLGAVTSMTSTPSGTYYTVTSNGVIAESRDGGVISKLKA